MLSSYSHDTERQRLKARVTLKVICRISKIPSGFISIGIEFDCPRLLEKSGHQCVAVRQTRGGHRLRNGQFPNDAAMHIIFDDFIFRFVGHQDAAVGQDIDAAAGKTRQADVEACNSLPFSSMRTMRPSLIKVTMSPLGSLLTFMICSPAGIENDIVSLPFSSNSVKWEAEAMNV